MSDTRYCIVGDDSGHKYYIPVGKEDEWYKWLEPYNSYDFDNQEPEPEWATRIDGRFSFTDPKCD